MKKLFKLFILVLIMIIPVFAFAQTAVNTVNTVYRENFLSCVENNLFNTNFPKDSLEIRVERIENIMFGRIYPEGPLEKRIIGLGKYWRTCIPKTSQVQELPPPPKIPLQTFSKITSPQKSLSQKYIVKNTTTLNKTIKKINTTTPDDDLEPGYPVVDEIEQKALGTTYKNEDIYKRLDRIEKAVFGGVSDATLSDRVDNLKNKVLGNYTQQNSNESFSSDSESMNIVDSDNLEGEVSRLENTVLGMQFSNETIENRLARIETQIFGKPDDNYSVEERIQRLKSFTDASQADDYYKDQAQAQTLNNAAVGVRIFSILFMILQALLL
jgi:hypothetical protein